MKKSNFELSNLATWSPLHGIIGFIAVAALVISLSYFVKIKEQIETTKSKETMLEKSLKDYKEKSKSVAELKYIQEEVDQLKLVLKETIKYLPTDEEWPTLVNNVYQSSKTNGINFDIYEPQEKIEEDYYMIQPIKLEAETGFKSITSFVQKVTSLDRIMNVESITAKNLDKEITKNTLEIEDRVISISGELRTYIFKDE